MKGVLLTLDGSKKLEAEFSAPLGKHQNLSSDCANSILSRGGRRLMNELQGTTATIDVFSTKKLTTEQLQKFNSSLKVGSEDFIKINPNRIAKSILKSKIENVILTSKNAVEALLTNVSEDELQFKNIYCVGRQTKRLIENRIGSVKHQEKNAKKLATHLVDYMEGAEVTYFCSEY